MAKWTVRCGVLAPGLLLAAGAAAEEPAGEAAASAEGSASVAIAPAEDPAAAAGPAPSPAAPVQHDERTFWEIIGEDNPNPATYEVGFVGIGLNKTWGIANWSGGGFYFGAGGGIGSNLYRISQIEDRDVGIDPTLEIVYGNLFLRITPLEYVDLDVGGRLALGASTFDVDDAPRGGFVRAGYVDLRVGSKKIKLGPRFEYGSIQYADLVESGWKITPLMLRVVND